MAGPAWRRKLTKVNTAGAKLANMHSQAVRQDPEVCLSFIEHPRLYWQCEAETYAARHFSTIPATSSE